MAPTLSSSFVSCLPLLSFLIGNVAADTSVWTVNCDPLSVQMADPIFSPGKISSHVHAVVGSTAFSRYMTGNSAAANGEATTCDKFTDHSNYWAPQLYHMRPDGRFELLPFLGMAAYYENYTCSYNPQSPGKCGAVRDAIGFPQGLQMVAGNAQRRTFNKSDPWQQAVLMENGNNGEGYGMPAKLDGQRLSGHARFPSCWDGIHLTSSDHYSHVAYPDASLGGDTQGGMCPESHPVALINIGAEFGWSLNGITDPTSLVFSNGDTTGYGFHADFYAGWKDPSALTASFSNCASGTNCPWRAFGSPTGQPPNPTTMNPEEPEPCEEDIGQYGPIDALPGNNQVYKPMRFMRDML